MRETVAIASVCIVVVLAGCAGWGTDSTVGGDDLDSIGSDELEETQSDADREPEVGAPSDGAPSNTEVPTENADDTGGDADAHTLSVHVVDAETGDPVDGPVSIAGPEHRATERAENGTAVFEGVHDGEYTLNAEIDGWYHHPAGEDSVSVDGTDTEHVLELYPEPETHALTVVVTDAETVAPSIGSPVSGTGGTHPSGADLLFRGETGSDGTVTFEGEYESRYDVDVTAKGYEMAFDSFELTEDTELGIEMTATNAGEGDENRQRTTVAMA